MDGGGGPGLDPSSSVSPEVPKERSQLHCSFPNCGKKFTRKDHLIRHAANHSQPNYHCATCGRSFQRLDLLQRHERRQICDDERYPKRIKTMVHVPEATPTPSATSTGQHTSLSPPAVHGRPDSERISPVNQQTQVHQSQSHQSQGQESQAHQSQGYQSHAHQSHSPHQQSQSAQAHAQQQQQSTHVHSHSVSPIAIEESFHRDVFPVIELPIVQPTSAVTTVAVSPEMDSTAPIALEPPSAEFGFGLWPPDPWETLIGDNIHPALWDESVPDAQMWSIPGNPQASAIRTQESAERWGRRELVMHRGVGPGLLHRILTTYPELALSMAELSDGLSLYWSDVAPSFPFVHRGTFDVETAPIELVTMMAVVGTVRGTGPSAQRDFRRLVRRIRARLVEDQLGLELEISTLQTFTLCHVYDVWHGDSETLFVAQCLWPVVVAHSRKQGFGVGGVPGETIGTAAWYTWAKDEERRRAAYTILFIDTQISSYWSQHPSRQMSVFAHNINLPSTRAQWEAPTAADWVRAREQELASPPRRPARSGHLPGLHPEFQVSVVSEGYSLAVLSALAADGQLPVPVDLDNTTSIMMILTGLCAIAWDCRTRGGMGIRFRDGTKHWRSVVLNAVVSLRAAFEMGVTHIPGCVESRDIRDQLAISIISILSDIPMLQVAAGATNICGASVGPKQLADSRRRLRLWATTQDAWTCLWQSARYLREALFAEWGLYTPWAVFLTTLVVWAYATSTREENAIACQPAHDNPHTSANAANVLLDSIYTSPTRVDHLDAGVADLVLVVAAKLKQGQPIDRDNAQLLLRLASGYMDHHKSEVRWK